MESQTVYTDEEICKSLMSELESLSDEEWEMLEKPDKQAN